MNKNVSGATKESISFTNLRKRASHIFRAILSRPFGVDWRSSHWTEQNFRLDCKQQCNDPHQFDGEVARNIQHLETRKWHYRHWISVEYSKSALMKARSQTESEKYFDLRAERARQIEAKNLRKSGHTISRTRTPNQMSAMVGLWLKYLSVHFQAMRTLNQIIHISVSLVKKSGNVGLKIERGQILALDAKNIDKRSSNRVLAFLTTAMNTNVGKRCLQIHGGINLELFSHEPLKKFLHVIGIRNRRVGVERCHKSWYRGLVSFNFIVHL
jgi:hypothetical protein